MTFTETKIKMIALCGWPKSGKSEVARILVERYGAAIVDDGEPLRKAAPHLFHGIDPEDCYTQEGKAKTITINDKTVTVRQALGYLGDVLEGFYGSHYLPDQALKKIGTMPPARYYVFPSVRKDQGHFYKRYGGEVWEIDRLGVKPSDNAFDKWDRLACDTMIYNHWGIEELERIVQHVMWTKFRDPGLTRIELAS